MQAEPCHVSVVIPLYNSAATLRRAVASALGQSLRDIEVLIVDDGSRDASLSLAHQLAAEDPRVRVIALPENRGKPHAMNVAIAAAGGTWMAVLDADDWYAPERLETLVTAGEAYQVALTADNQLFYDAAADCFVRTAFPVDNGDRTLTKTAFIAGSDPYADFNYGLLKPVVRTDFIRRTGLLYRENARLSEDFLYLVEFFAAGGTGVLLAQPLYNWTQPFGSRSRQWTTTGAGSWRYDFRSALTANTEVLHMMREQRQNDLAQLLVSRARAYKRLHSLNELNKLRAEGAGLPRLLAAVIQHPSIWPRLVRRVVDGARHRYQDVDPALQAAPPSALPR
jgi:glycosyltransferase involved in cell wall biosynthesis